MIRSGTTWGLPGLLLGMFLLLACCGRDSAHEASKGTQEVQGVGPGTEPVAGGTAVIALYAEPDGLNSLLKTSIVAGIVLAEIGDTLTEMGEDLTMGPSIASSWQLAPDSLSIAYQLRPWVWEDGQSLTAYDVAASFSLFKDERVASPLRGFFSQVLRAVPLDSATIRYEFERPIGSPLVRTTHAILPAHLITRLDPGQVRTWPLNSKPLSSGPFRLERWDRKRQLTLVANDNYPGVHARLERVILRVIPEESARVIALETGEVDFLCPLPRTAARRLKSSGKVRVEMVHGRIFYYLVWNFQRTLFSDLRVRKALSLALDRERMIETLLLGYGMPANSPIPPVMWNHHEGLAPDRRDLGLARRLLAEAGWRDEDGDGILEKDGRPFRFEILLRHGDPVREDGVMIMRENLLEVGVVIEPRTMEHAGCLAKLRGSDFEAYFGQFNANLFGDPSGLIRSTAHDEFNFGGYANQQVDALLDQALAQTDREEALPYWLRLQEVLHEDPPAAILFYPETLVGISDRLQDVRPHLLSPLNNLAEWWIKPADRRYLSH